MRLTRGLGTALLVGGVGAAGLSALMHQGGLHAGSDNGRRAAADRALVLRDVERLMGDSTLQDGSITLALVVRPGDCLDCQNRAATWRELRIARDRCGSDLRLLAVVPAGPRGEAARAELFQYRVGWPVRAFSGAPAERLAMLGPAATPFEAVWISGQRSAPAGAREAERLMPSDLVARVLRNLDCAQSSPSAPRVLKPG